MTRKMTVKTTPVRPRLISPAAARLLSVAFVSVIAVVIVTQGHGFTAAAIAEDAAKASDLSPINLAGRWTGPRYASNMRAAGGQDCGGNACQLTYDIVACPDGWCGIAVSDETPCGAIAVHLKEQAAPKRHNAFTGKLELVKDAAAYTVEAWYSPAGEQAGEGSEHPHLNFVGDTGDGGMLMLRRSFPFQAELARTGDAQCTLEKATS